ncbi:T9SS type A sorting domain-containing protein [Fulvivirga kasyanovii]|uniref:T9SS type A sorting domain-containing protein n=5 Tax=Fulvivirga kasyanovii TaxID=396812 RepID=A0ABW9RI29_9BACT|nr:T9SS type A sorting domain-containing protein [Fulvivirga kasyanovii]
MSENFIVDDIKKSSVTGINNSNESIIFISPNPIESKKFLSVRNASFGSVYNIIDSNGKLLDYGALDETGQININGLNPGLYLLKLNEGKSINILRFVIIN